MYSIQKISAQDTYSVRHPVLRKGKPIATCHFDGDDLATTSHFGFFSDKELIGVLSLYKKSNTLFLTKEQSQIRGMALLKNQQKKGFGEALVLHCEKDCIARKIALIWFNARIQAVGFYEKLGYTQKGDPFEIENVGEHIVMFKKLT